MPKRSKIVDPPEWLSSIKYDQLRELDARGWASLLGEIAWFNSFEEPIPEIFEEWERRRFSDKPFRNPPIFDSFGDSFSPFKEVGEDAIVFNESSRLIALDLNCPDEVLIHSLRKWLDIQRKNFPIVVKRSGPRKTSKKIFTAESHYNKWIEHKIVEISDIRFWARQTKQKVSRPMIGNWVFDTDSDTEDKVRYAEKEALPNAILLTHALFLQGEALSQ